MGFGVSYYFSWEADRSNDRMLQTIKHVSLPIHHHSSLISFYTDQLIRLYERSVITEDEEALEDSGRIIAAIKDSLDTIAVIYAADKVAHDKILKIMAEFDSYAVSSDALSRKLIAGETSLTEVHADLEAQNNLVNQVKQETKKLEKKSHAEILRSIENSRRNIQTTEKVNMRVFAVILIMVMMFYYLVRSSILAPILAISATSQKAAVGDFDYVATKPPNNEIGILIGNFNDMILKIKRNRNQLAAIEKESLRLSSCGSFDSLITAIPESITRVTLGEVDEAGLSVFFRDTCFIDEDRKPGFYQWHDGRWHLADIDSRGENRHSQHIQPIRDPRTGKVIGFMSYPLSKDMPEETYKAVEVLASPVANAVAAIMLEKATQLVQKKTDEMALLLNNIEQGIFITDASLVVGPSYSPKLEGISGRKELTGKPILDTVFTGLSSELKTSIETVVLCSIGEDIALGFDCNVQALPRTITRRINDAVQIIEIKWLPIVDASDIVREIMVCIEDVTELKALESQREQNRAEMQRVYRLLKMGDRSFVNFVRCAAEFYGRIADVGAEFGGTSKGQQQLKLALHKHKGTARILGMADLATAAHEMEDTVEAIGMKGKSELIRHIGQFCGRSQQLLGHYKKAYTDLLGKPLDRAEKLYSADTLRYYVHKWQAMEHTDIGHLENYLTVRDKGWTDLSSLVREVAESFLKTRQIELTIEEKLDDNFIYEDHDQVIRDCLVHLFNNSIDHGKVAELGSTISIWQSKPSPDTIAYHYRDHGAGLNLAALQRKLSEAGHDDADELSPERLANSIFMSGLSSKDDVSQTSGRGVGMDVVRDGIESIKGTITVELIGEPSPTKQAFQVNMTFPAAVVGTIDEVLYGRFKDYPQSLKGAKSAA